MIPKNQDDTDNPANAIENQNLEEYFFIILVFGVEITAEIRNENQK